MKALVVEDDFTSLRTEGGRLGGVSYLWLGDGEAGHVLGVIQAALRHTDVLADIAQIAGHQHERGDREAPRDQFLVRTVRPGDKSGLRQPVNRIWATTGHAASVTPVDAF